MNSFKLWLEEQENNTEARLKKYFDLVMQKLQATEDDLSKSLDELPAVRTPKPANGESQPPQHGQGATTKVRQLLGDTLQQMSGEKTDPQISVRANRTLELLNRKSNDGKVSPDLYLQDVLRELFGNDFHADFFDGQSSQDNTPMPSPDDSGPQQQQDPAAAPDMNDPTGGMGMDQPPADDMGMGQPDMGMDPQVPPTDPPMPNQKPFGGNQFV